MSTSLVEDCMILSPNDVLGHHPLHPDIHYWVEEADIPSFISLHFKNGKEQTLNLEWSEITFGTRAYFTCTCGSMVGKLYLPAQGNEFKCRACHGLKYRLSSYNRHSTAGRALYQVDRLQKLSENRASMGRIFYKGNFTKPFQRFLRQCDRAGFKSIVDGANDLKMLVGG